LKSFKFEKKNPCDNKGAKSYGLSKMQQNGFLTDLKPSFLHKSLCKTLKIFLV